MAIITVNSASDVVNANDGLTTLREAINQANNTYGEKDTIQFAPSLRGATITLTNGQLSIDSDIDIIGPASTSNSITISGNNTSRVFNISSYNDVNLSNVKITDGNVLDGGGGGIYLEYHTSINLNNCQITNNVAVNGGGIYSYGNVNITNSQIFNNQATSGAGGGIYNDGEMIILQSNIFANQANYGGGIFNDEYRTLSLNNSSVYNNLAINFGGGIYNDDDSTLTTDSSTIFSNQAFDSGGGIVNDNANSNITNTTISANRAKNWGGGIYNYKVDSSSDQAVMQLNNSTITANVADSDNDNTGDGGGVINYRGNVNVKNTIIAANNDRSSSTKHHDVSGSFLDLSGNLIGRKDGSTGFTTSSLVGTISRPVQPKLGPLANNGGFTRTHALLPGSPAINRGSSLGPVAFDQRGGRRPYGAGIDIGAFEYGASVRINGTARNDRLVGGLGNDTIVGLAGNDTLIGNAGSDLINGGTGNDSLLGGAGNDNLIGGVGNDNLRGDAGNDTLNGWGGRATEKDRMVGGTGNDRFILGTSSGAYYNKGRANDYAIITDFRVSGTDVIQLKGNSSQYQLKTPPSGLAGVGLYQGAEFIALIQGGRVSNGQAVNSTSGFVFV